MASARTNSVEKPLAIAELSIGPTRPRSPSRAYWSNVSGAKTLGGLVAASTSEWNDVSTIHADGHEEHAR